MQINKVQTNNPSFGIRYLNKEAWNPEVLKAFEKSHIVKAIDKRYNNAAIHYAKITDEEGLGNSELLHTLILDIKLAKDKFYRWNLSSHKEFSPEKNLIKDLDNLTLMEVEQRSVQKLMPLYSIDISFKEENPIKAFFKRLFS